MKVHARDKNQLTRYEIGSALFRRIPLDLKTICMDVQYEWYEILVTKINWSFHKKKKPNWFRTVPMNELYSDDFYDRQCVACMTESCRKKKGSLGRTQCVRIFDTSHRAVLVKRISTSLPHSVVSLTRCHMCALPERKKNRTRD